MKRLILRAVCVLLALALCIGLTGCYSEANSWSAKRGDETLSIGTYIYFLSNAYTEARELVPADEEVLKATIEDVSAEEWIEKRAKEYIGTYFFLQDALKAEGVTLTQEDEDEISETSDTAWGYYRTSMEEVGVAEKSFEVAYARFTVCYEKLMEHLYGEGGRLAPTEEELRQYFIDNYYHYEYFYSTLTATGDDGSTVEVSDEDKALRMDTMEKYAQEITEGKATTEEEARTFADLFEPASTVSEDGSVDIYMAPSILPAESLSDTFRDTLAGLTDGAAAAVEGSNGLYYVITRLSTEDVYDDYVSEEDQRTALLYGLKGEEFEDYVTQGGRDLSDVTYNDHAIGRVKLSSFIDDSNKLGARIDDEEEEETSSESPVESEAEASSAAE